MRPQVVSHILEELDDESFLIVSAYIQQLEQENRRFDSTKFTIIPKKPTDGMLMSMAIRSDHGLGLPGYYDSPLFGGKITHQQRLDSTISSMRQLYEEVAGEGFYNPNLEEDYKRLKDNKHA